MAALAALVVAALLVDLPGAAALPASPAAAPWVRLVADHDDDWTAQRQVQDGFDLVALDGRLAFEPIHGGDVLVLRFVLDGGRAALAPGAAALTARASFVLDGAAHAFEVQTTDLVNYNGTFDAVRGPFAALRSDGTPDGTRLAVDGIVGLERLTLDAQSPTPLTAWKVEAFAGTTAGDVMPQGLVPTAPDPGCVVQPDACAAYDIGAWTPSPPSSYVDVRVDPAALAIQTTASGTASVRVANPFVANAQVVRVLAYGDGLLIGFDGTSAPNAFTTFGLPALDNATLTITVTAPPNVNGVPIRLELTTDLGGHVVVEVPVDVAAPPAPPPLPPGATPTQGGAGGAPTVPAGGATSSNASTPGASLPLVLVALAAIALATRRRHAS